MFNFSWSVATVSGILDWKPTKLFIILSKHLKLFTNLELNYLSQPIIKCSICGTFDKLLEESLVSRIREIRNLCIHELLFSAVKCNTQKETFLCDNLYIFWFRMLIWFDPWSFACQSVRLQLHLLLTYWN